MRGFTPVQANFRSSSLSSSLKNVRNHVILGRFIELAFGDIGNQAATGGETGDLDDQVNGAGDLAAEGEEGDADVGHESHGFEAVAGVGGGGGVEGGEGAVVAGGHGLDHVEGLAAADFTDDDAVGAHAEGGDEEVADGDEAAAVGIGGAGFHLDDMGLLDLEFAGVFDDDDAFVIAEGGGEDVDGGGFTGPGTTGDDDVEVGLDAEEEEFEGHRCDGLLFEEEGGGGGIEGEAADVDVGAGGGDFSEDDADA